MYQSDNINRDKDIALNLQVNIRHSFIHFGAFLAVNWTDTHFYPQLAGSQDITVCAYALKSYFCGCVWPRCMIELLSIVCVCV